MFLISRQYPNVSEVHSTSYTKLLNNTLLLFLSSMMSQFICECGPTSGNSFNHLESVRLKIVDRSFVLPGNAFDVTLPRWVHFHLVHVVEVCVKLCSLSNSAVSGCSDVYLISFCQHLHPTERGPSYQRRSDLPVCPGQCPHCGGHRGRDDHCTGTAIQGPGSHMHSNDSIRSIHVPFPQFTPSQSLICV